MMARMASRPGRAEALQIEQQNVGFEFERLGNGLVAIRGFAIDFKAFLLGEHVRTHRCGLQDDVGSTIRLAYPRIGYPPVFSCFCFLLIPSIQHPAYAAGWSAAARKSARISRAVI